VTSDVALGCAMLVVAVAYYLAAAAIPETLLSDAIGPEGLPKIYAVVLAGLSLILIGGSLRGWRKPKRVCATGTESAQDEQLPDARGASPIGLARVGLRVAGMLAIGALYVVVVPWLGYVPTLAVLIAGTTYYQGGVFSRQVVIVAVAGAISLWLLFVMLLRIPQPTGLWPW
jgi:hypothetical protein